MADVSKTNSKPKVSDSETPRQRFIRLAEKRTSVALQAMHNISQLANTAQYQYTDEDADMITAALVQAANEAGKSLRQRKPPRSASFHLSQVA